MSILLESNEDLEKKPITVVSVRKKRTGGWLQQDGLRDLIGESFKAQRHNMYFYHYMIFALLNVCFCHQRPHYVTIHNTEPHEGSFWEGKKTRIPEMVTKTNDHLKKKNLNVFVFLYLKIEVCQIQSHFLFLPVLWFYRFDVNIRAPQMCVVLKGSSVSM